MLVGIKPTVGRISRHGIIPITADQDTAGPMARTVADAAILLGVLEGAAPDPNDPATKACPRAERRLHAVPQPRAARRRAHRHPPRDRLSTRRATARLLREAIALLQQHGATVVDPADIPHSRQPCAATKAGIRGKDGTARSCSIRHEARLQRVARVAWIRVADQDADRAARMEPCAPRRGAIKYGQAQLDISDEMDLERDRARYLADREKDVRMTGAEGIDAVMKRERLDALLFPGSTGAAVAAKPGYPTVIVPFGFVPNAPQPPFPPGFDAKPAPLGISFTGGACSEPRLIEIAYAFEQATKAQDTATGISVREEREIQEAKVEWGSLGTGVQSPESESREQSEMSRTMSVEVEQVGPSTAAPRRDRIRCSSIARSKRAAAIAARLAVSTC